MRGRYWCSTTVARPPPALFFVSDKEPIWSPSVASTKDLYRLTTFAAIWIFTTDFVFWACAPIAGITASFCSQSSSSCYQSIHTLIAQCGGSVDNKTV